jgi:dTDP-4-amino-4,6-dideoxy-D-galactose acyltransferase
MNPPYAFLDWDSVFFNRKIGRLLPAHGDAGFLQAALAQAREEGYDLLYWYARPTEANHEAAMASGGWLADRKRTYLHGLEGLRTDDLRVNWFIDRAPEIGEGEAADPELEQLAITAGVESRFLRDPGFSQADFERLYREWIRKSQSRKLAEEVLYIEDFGRKRAMLTLGLKMGRPDIGLIATDADYRGRGMAGDLVRASLVWAINRDYREAQVLTQAENTGACAFYEALGYRVEREDWVYHFWL